MVGRVSGYPGLRVSLDARWSFRPSARRETTDSDLDLERADQDIVLRIDSDIMPPKAIRYEDPGAEICADRIEVVTPRGLSLRSNFAWTLTGNIVYGACQWGMLVALAKLGSPQMVGRYALGLAIGGPVMMFASLCLRAVQVTDARNEYRFGLYLALRLLTAAAALAIIVAVVGVARFRWETAFVVFLVGVAKSVESVSDILYGLFQKFERLDRIAIAMMLRGVGSLVSFALTLWLTGSLPWAVLALAGWWLIVLFTYERPTGATLLRAFAGPQESFAPSWEWKTIARLARYSLPLGVVLVLTSLNMNVPRYFVEHYLGEAALGYFAAMGYVMVAGYTVMGALGQSASPRLAKYHVSDRSAYWRLLAKMVLLALAVGGSGILVATLWGRPLLTLLYRRDYAQYSNVFVWIMVAAAISYVSSMFGYSMTAARIFRPQVPLFATSCVTIAVTCALLIKNHGILGGAYALLIGSEGMKIAVIGGGSILFFSRRRRALTA